MSAAPAHGTPVADHERLWRGLRATELGSDGRPSSAPFKYHPKFSADVARLTTVADCIARLPQTAFLAAFNAGFARSLEFNSVHEPENGNDAHAHVYTPTGSSQRSKRARELAASCVSVALPGLPPP